MSFNDLAKKEASMKKDTSTDSPKPQTDTKDPPVATAEASPSKT